jgi:hypothetical protein
MLVHQPEGSVQRNCSVMNEPFFKLKTISIRRSLWNFRFLRRREWRRPSSGMLLRVVLQKLTDVSEVLTASVISYHFVDGGSKQLWKVGQYFQGHTAQLPTRPSSSSFWKLTLSVRSSIRFYIENFSFHNRICNVCWNNPLITTQCNKIYSRKNSFTWISNS